MLRVALCVAALATLVSSVPATAARSESLCPTLDVLLCDGFENDEIDPRIWGVEASAGNTVELTTERAARGRQSIHIHAENGFGFLRLTRIFPLEGNRYWARMFVRVERFSTVPWAHWTLAETAGAGDGSVIRVGGQFVSTEQINRWSVGSDHGPTGDWTTHDQDPAGAPVAPAVGEWVCLEWLHDATADRSRFFVGGVEHPSLATSRSEHGGADAPFDVPSLRSVWFGWWQYQPDPEPFDIWIDEIAVDHDRIGCDR